MWPCTSFVPGVSELGRNHELGNERVEGRAVPSGPAEGGGDGETAGEATERPPAETVPARQFRTGKAAALKSLLLRDSNHSMVQWQDGQPECWEAWGPQFNPRTGGVGIWFLYKLWQPANHWKPLFITLLCLSPNYKERLLCKVSYAFHIIIHAICNIDLHIYKKDLHILGLSHLFIKKKVANPLESLNCPKICIKKAVVEVKAIQIFTFPTIYMFNHRFINLPGT